jgi:hypothetical protein
VAASATSTYQDDGGNVGGDERVDSSAGSGQLRHGVGHGRAQGTGDYSGHVDQKHPPPAVHHLQGDPDEDLHRQVHHQV